jgi:hypothetical protein
MQSNMEGGHQEACSTAKGKSSVPDTPAAVKKSQITIANLQGVH